MLEPDLGALDPEAMPELPTHNVDPVKVLHLARNYGQLPARVLVVGCEPATFGDEAEGAMGLSAPVQAAFDEAVQLVETLAQQICAETEPAQG